MTSDVVAHVPHASVVFPKGWAEATLPSSAELQAELDCMTDAATDVLARLALPDAVKVVAPFSRLVLDCERFEDDAQESMSAVGMGVIYTHTSAGRRLRNTPSGVEREALLAEHYRPHHEALRQAVATALAAHGRCLVLDIHSYPLAPLPFELGRGPRPEICLGTDSFHTSAALTQRFERAFKDRGYEVALNSPFAGALVPSAFFGRDARVAALMIEVRRDMYLQTDAKTVDEPAMQRLASTIRDAVQAAWSLPA